MTCKIVEWSRALGIFTHDKVEPGETSGIGGETGVDADCANTGVTIISVVATIRPEDDDGGLTLQPVAITGLDYRIPYVVGAEQTQRMYAISATVTYSDGSKFIYWHALNVQPTRIPWAA